MPDSVDGVSEVTGSVAIGENAQKRHEGPTSSGLWKPIAFAKSPSELRVCN